MINTTRTRKKYIAYFNDIPANFKSVEYRISINNANNVVFVGKPTHIDKTLEVDVTDFIEQYLDNAYLDDFTIPSCIVNVTVSIIREDGSLLTLSKPIEYQPENISLEPVNQIGMITGSASGVASVFNNITNYPIAIAIYPIFYFTFNASYKQQGNPRPPLRVTLESYFDPYPEFILRGNDVYKYSLASGKGISQSEWDNTMKDTFIDNLMYIHSPEILKNTPLYQSPTLMISDRLNPNMYIRLPLDVKFESKTMPPIESIYFSKFDDYDEVRDLNNFTFSYNEEFLKGYYDDQILPYIEQIGGTYTMPNGDEYTNIQLTPNGYGYKILMLYKSTSYSPFSNSFGLWSDQIVRVAKTSDCNGANLVLFNSGYGMGSGNWKNTHALNTIVSSMNIPKEVTIPLMVKNGMLVGKTNNLLEKTTYIDRYGDEHNSITSNHYEIECYIDSEWLKPTTTNDQNYEKVMMALQNAKKTYLCTNVGISGIDGDDVILEGHIKNVEKIETHSSYSASKQLTYKITFELY